MVALESSAGPQRKPSAFESARSTQDDRETTLGVLREIWDQPQSIKFGDLMRLSPKARVLAGTLLRKNRVPQDKQRGEVALKEAVVNLLEEINRDLGLPEATIADDILQAASNPDSLDGVNLRVGEVFLQDLRVPSAFVADGSTQIPAGGVVCPDPVESFLIENSGTAVRGSIAIPASEKIRTIFPVVNRTKEDEHVVDDGSQVCSASEVAAREVGISWDPKLQIGLTSANATTTSTMGLARNVPVDCGNGVVAYVQFHIVKDAPYRFLLGRPFLRAMLAASINKSDGGHTLGLTDPNNGQQVVIPTYPRGSKPGNIAKTGNF